MHGSNPKGDLNSIASISTSSTISIPSSEPSASKPRDSKLKREQNPRYRRHNGLIYIPSASSCNQATLDPDAGKDANGRVYGGVYKYTERNESDIIVVDPFTGEVKKKVHKPYPNHSAALTTAGSLLFTGFIDGSFAAYDDISLEQLWEVNVGVGLDAPPTTFEAGGKQYVAILTGLSRPAKNTLVNTPELREMRNQTMLFVFGL
jgi:alcohol dehydrogenase (cytochrome c)